MCNCACHEQGCPRVEVPDEQGYIPANGAAPGILEWTDDRLVTGVPIDLSNVIWVNPNAAAAAAPTAFEPIALGG